MKEIFQNYYQIPDSKCKGEDEKRVLTEHMPFSLLFQAAIILSVYSGSAIGITQA